MKKAAFLVLLVALASAAFASPADLTGKWKVTGSISDMPIDITCSLKQADGKLTGSCQAEEIGELTLKGESDGKAVSWSYDVSFQGQAFTVVYKGTVASATEITGSISVMDQASGTFKAVRQ